MTTLNEIAQFPIKHEIAQLLIDLRANARIVTAFSYPSPDRRCQSGDCTRYASLRYYFDSVDEGEIWVDTCTGHGEGYPSDPAEDLARLLRLEQQRD